MNVIKIVDNHADRPEKTYFHNLLVGEFAVFDSDSESHSIKKGEFFLKTDRLRIFNFRSNRETIVEFSDNFLVSRVPLGKSILITLDTLGAK